MQDMERWGTVQPLLCIAQMSFKTVLCHERRQWDLLIRVFKHLDLSKGFHFLEQITWKKSIGWCHGWTDL